MRYPRLFTAFILAASLSIHLYADLAISSIVTAGAGIATWLGTPSSANLMTALTDETGTSGGVVFAGTPTLTTPVIGAATGTSLVLTGGGVTVGTATYAASKIYNTAVEGLNIAGSAGSSFDLNIMNKNGSSVMTTPTGTTSVVIAGGLTITGIAAGSAGDTDACLDATTNQLKDANANTCIVSSLRFKDWHGDLLPSESLAKVLRLTPGTYQYKASLSADTCARTLPADIAECQRAKAVLFREHVGFFAENMAAVEPRLAFFEKDGTTPLTINFEETTALLASAIQQLAMDNATLRARLTAAGVP